MVTPLVHFVKHLVGIICGGAVELPWPPMVVVLLLRPLAMAPQSQHLCPLAMVAVLLTMAASLD